MGAGRQTAEGSAADCLRGGGEMGALARAKDWALTSLGPVEAWPQSLRTAASILLESRFPMYIAWGPDYVQLYNDGYRPILGATKHPAAMGRRASETFAESWHIIGPMFDEVRTGKAIGSEDWMLPLDRNGYLEECYFTFSYSPIRAESGGVGGVLVTVTETTARVIGARRLRVLHELSEQTAALTTPEQACVAAARALETDRADVPFALLYLLHPQADRAHLVATANLDPASAAAPREAALQQAPGSGWPLGEALAAGEHQEVADLATRFGPLPGGEWPEPAQAALVLPIARPGQLLPAGFLIVGLSPRLRLDRPYREFLGLAARHIATAVNGARAFEEERHRARELAELDRAKTAFFSNVSHEFRTPLTLLLGPAEEALATGQLPPLERERWQLVHRNGQRLSKLVNNLLDFARIEAGRAEAAFAPTDLAALTGDLASMFRSAIDRAGLRLELHLEPGLGEVYVDQEMWEKIVLNLLSNAIKFTFEGTIAVTQRREGEGIETIVSDTGTGIDAEELPRLFDRFHRVRGARARTSEGTGIGLALVKELVGLHRGRVQVESVRGQGTSFRVWLPFGHAHLPPARVAPLRPATLGSARAAYVAEATRWLSPADETAAPRETPEPAGPAYRILLAEDNADMRDYLARLLRERWEVEVVADGQTALEAIRLRPPDLLLSDVMMPRLDGFALLRALREDRATRALPVVLLSARAGEESAAEGLNAGANDYLVKPFSARDLLVRVAAQLGSAAAARELQTATERERERLSRHFMQAPFPIGVLRGPGHVFELANQQALRVWGKKPDIVGKPLLEAIPELVGQPFAGYLDGVFRTGVAFEGKEELARLARGPGGALEDAYFNFVYSPLFDRGGQVEGVLVAGFEVTHQVAARRQVESALAEAARLNEDLRTSQRLFRTLADHLPALAWAARPDGYIDFYNQPWFDYTGTTLEQMQGWGWQAVHDPSMLDEVTARWRQAIATGERFEMEFPLRGKDGAFRWFLTRVQPVRDDRGQIVRWVGTNSDVNEQREDRRRIDEFLAMLGHELRNPLAPIATAVKLMELKGDDRLSRERKVIERQVGHLSHLVNDLLDVSRIAQGKIALSRKLVDVAEIADRAVEMAGPLLESRGHRLSVFVPRKELLVEADPVRLSQVLGNLLTNAAKYTPPGGKIELHASRDRADVVVRVRDNGIGIPSDLLPRIFGLFVQGPRGLDRSEGGLGLGLAVVKNLVELHGGSVVAQSAGPGQGSEFSVRIPAAQAAVSQAGAP